jgi:phosphatidylinositol dimannoside acyltransferase
MTSPPAIPPSPLAAFALRLLFGIAGRAPWLLRAIRPFAARLVVLASSAIRDGTASNARRIFSKHLSRRDERVFATKVVGSFYDFVLDVARFRSASAAELRTHIEGTDGLDAYNACRKSERGAILVTAHMGSFEVGLAALVGAEPKVHIVYKRDPFAAFDTMREQLRTRLGARGIAIDDGWPSLFAMRTALERDEVVVLQGDRAMPGQRCQQVSFLGGHLALPLGPVTLSRIVGSPIVPVFTVRTARDRFRVHLLPPIEFTAHEREFPDTAGSIDPALLRIAAAIEQFVARHPEQWLVLSPAFVEDQPRVC